MSPLKRLILPQKYELIAYPFTGFLILIASNISYFFNKIIGQETFQKTPGQYVDHLSDIIGHRVPLDSVSTLIFWAIVGAIVYAVGWMSINALLEARNTIEIGTHYMRPKNQTQGGFIMGTLGHIGLQLAVFIIMIGVTSLITEIYPQILGYFIKVFSNPGSVINWVYFVFAILITGFLLYLYAVLLRLLLRRIRVFNDL